MALDTYALVSLADMKDHLDVADASQDTRIETFINAATGWMERFTERRLLKREDIVEIRDGRRNNRILLSQWPVLSVSELWDDSSGDFTDVNNQIDSDNYTLEGPENAKVGIVLLGGLRFNNSNRNIKIVYDAGYDAAVDEHLSDINNLGNICKFIVEFWFNMRENRRVGQKSKGKNNESTSFHDTIPPHIKEALEPYKRPFLDSMFEVAVGNSD